MGIGQPPPPGGPPPGGPQPPAGGPPPAAYPKPDNSLPVLTHVLGLFTGFLGPLILFLAVKDDARVRRHAAAALNWQLSLLIYMLGSIALAFVLAFALAPLFFLLFLIWFALFAYDLVVCVVSAVNASNGKDATYPGALPMVSAT